MFFFYTARGMRPNANVAAQIFFRQQSGIESVIKVVAVISDFVGEIGDLRFERGIFGVKSFPPAGMIISGIMLSPDLRELPM